MSGARVCLASILAVAGLALPARGQAVISTRSGLVHFFEGQVSVAGRPLEPRAGKFTSIPEGSELQTGKGRAEVLLTPGVFLRVGENSAVRMVATALPATRVEVLAGSAIVDTVEPTAGTSVTVIFRNWSISQAQKGAFRMDCDPPHLSVRQGHVEVRKGSDGTPVEVEEGKVLPFADVLAPEDVLPPPPDALDEWVEGRAESVSADDAIAANIADPASLSGMDLPEGSFTYYPMLGLSSLPASSLPSTSGAYGSSSGYSAGLAGSINPAQLGFYSLYLPGYTYRPLLLYVPLYRSPLSYPFHIGAPNLPGIHAPSYHPIVPPSSRPASHIGGVGAHTGGHVGVGRR